MMNKNDTVLFQQIAREWDDTPSVFPNIKIIENNEKLYNEKSLMDNLPKLLDLLTNFPNDTKKQKNWIKRARLALRKILKNQIFYQSSFMNETMANQLIDITLAFLKDARHFDRNLSIQDIGQAMRNVWIVTILQLLFEHGLMYSKATFAYSMLYPYSDNYLDQGSIEYKEKDVFNEHFYQRLKGINIKPNSLLESQIFDLIQMIEDCYPRALFPSVYDGLYMIMDGQIRSLAQQRKEEKAVIESLMEISIEKGAASVIADGYLIRGEMSQDELLFCARYGFMLQLGDDLQDMVEDRIQNHATYFSLQSSIEERQQGVIKLLNYTNQICAGIEDNELGELVKKNSMMLIFISVIKNPAYFESDFLEQIALYLPISLNGIKQLTEMIQSHPAYQVIRSEERCKEIIDCMCNHSY